jgi:hypothetical protein
VDVQKIRRQEAARQIPPLAKLEKEPKMKAVWQQNSNGDWHATYRGLTIRSDTTPAKIASVRRKDPREQVAMISPDLRVDFPAQKDGGDRGGQQHRVSSPSRNLGVMIFIV